jgi:hypothetical protein
MTDFFLPPSGQGAAEAEAEYGKLREEAEACTGAVARDRRIREIECRRQGLDCRLSVGALDTLDGRTVSAILQLGRDTYTVHHVASEPGVPMVPTVLQRTNVYCVADFD